MANHDVPGRWLHQRVLGAGAFGVVELWRNDYTNKLIATKKCRGDSHQLSKKQKERWMNEVETIYSLTHPNIVSTIPVPSQLGKLQADLPILCMEYCRRGDLRTLLNQSSNFCGIKEREALRIMYDVASAVEYLHSKNFTHRDLKPENIVLQDSGEKTIYKLTDLGYVCELGETTVDASVVGTLNYLAPELLWMTGYKCSVDYWSLGIIFYEIVTGRRPFLPDMDVTPAWIEHVKKKTNDDICARQENGQVVFSTKIEIPTTISECVQNQLTTWFRIALRWDPKSRGRMKNEQGISVLKIFHLLKSILSHKIIHVFVMPFYRVDSYAVSPTISIRELKTLIRDKTQIELDDQILTDSKCNVLLEPASSILNYNCAEEWHLTVFHKNFSHVDIQSKPHLSSEIQLMLREPKTLLDSETISRYYGAAVFFLKQELALFSSYIIALSIKIDLSKMGLDDLCGIVTTLTTSANKLMNDIAVFAQSPEYGRMSDELRGSVETTRSKMQKLVDGTKEVISKLNGLIEDFNNLKTFSENNWLEQWTSLYDKAMGYLEARVKSNRNHPKSSPVNMVKLLYRALKFREEQLRRPPIASIVRDIMEFDKNVIQLQTALNSFRVLVERCHNNYEGVVTKRAIDEQCLAFINSRTPSDAVIFDNIVLRNLIDSLDVSHPSSEDMFENFDDSLDRELVFS